MPFCGPGWQGCLLSTPYDLIGDDLTAAGLWNDLRRRAAFHSTARAGEFPGGMTAKDKNQTAAGLISIKVQTILNLKKVIGAGEVTLMVPHATPLKALLEIMVEKGGEALASRLCEPGHLTPLSYIRLMVNGRDIAFLNRLETECQAGDEVLILPPVAGG